MISWGIINTSQYIGDVSKPIGESRNFTNQDSMEYNGMMLRFFVATAHYFGAAKFRGDGLAVWIVTNFSHGAPAGM